MPGVVWVAGNGPVEGLNRDEAADLMLKVRILIFGILLVVATQPGEAVKGDYGSWRAGAVLLEMVW